MSIKPEINSILSSIPEYIQRVQCDVKKKTQPFKCAVKSCDNRYINYELHLQSGFKFHRFPTNEALLNIWKRNCGLEETDDVKKLMVCSDHFSLDDYVRNYYEEFSKPYFKRKLKPDAIPTHKLAALNISDNDSESIVECYIYINHDIESEKPKSLIKENINYQEVKKEVDDNFELSQKEISLKNELKRLEKQLNYWDRKLKNLEVNNLNKRDPNVQILYKVFSKAQVNVLLGRKATWTHNDLAKAFTIRHMGSKKCYLYLKNTLKIPLPSLSCLQKWANSYQRKKSKL